MYFVQTLLQNKYDPISRIKSKLPKKGRQKKFQKITLKDYPNLVSHCRECISMVAAGAQTRRSLGHHLLHPLILRLLVLYAPAVLRPRALQDAPAPADPNS